MICALCSMLMALLSLFLRLSKMACQYPHLVLIFVVNDRPISLGNKPATECIAADVILDFKSGRGFWLHSLIVNDNLSCKKLFATDEIVARGGNQIRMIGGEYGALWRNDGAKTYLYLPIKVMFMVMEYIKKPFAIDRNPANWLLKTELYKCER